MAINKILSGIIEDFCEKNMFSGFSNSKAYEYIVNYSIISKFHPEAFADPQDMKVVDVDAVGAMFGLDCVAFIINDNLVLSKSDIQIYSKSNSLDVKILFIQTKIEEHYDSGDVLKVSNAVKSFLGDRKLLLQSDEMKNAFEIYDELCRYQNSRLFNSVSPKCYIYFITAGRPCEDQLLIDICKSEEQAILSAFPDIKDVEYQIRGSDYVANSYKEVENRIEVHINFKNSLSMDRIESVEQSYLGYLTGEEFLKIIVDSQGNLRRRLFYENVRDYQGNNPVNGEIRNTLISAELHDKFILLNNGITIVAKHFKPLGSNEYEMTDFQIVNGCQTSNEIYLQKGKINDILIPIKIIHTIDSNLIAMIVKASNRQTPVPDEAFIAMEEYHKKLQEIFDLYSREMPLKLYYERRSGEFDFLEKRPRRYQIISLHGLIRAITSVYFANAYVVYNNNPVNILRNRKNQLFQDDHIPEIYYVSNYLLAEFNYLNYRKKFGGDENGIRYYVPMVARSLLTKKMQIPRFNSNDAKKEANYIISLLTQKPTEVENTFVQSVKIIKQSLETFKERNGKMTNLEILKSQKFNRLVEDNTKKYLQKR